MTYVLQPGTIAHLSWKYLRTLASDVEISTAELATAIGQPSSAMVPSTQSARNHGLIRARYREDNKRHLWWSIGDGVPPEKPAIDDGEEEDRPMGKPFVAPPLSMRSVFDMAHDIPVFVDAPPPEAVIEAAQVAGKDSAEGHADQRPPRVMGKPKTPERAPEATSPIPETVSPACEPETPAPETQPPLTRTDEPQAPDIRVAIWSDGGMQIRRGEADLAVFSPGEARQLLDALDRMLGREHAE